MIEDVQADSDSAPPQKALPALPQAKKEEPSLLGLIMNLLTTFFKDHFSDKDQQSISAEKDPQQQIRSALFALSDGVEKYMHEHNGPLPQEAVETIKTVANRLSQSDPSPDGANAVMANMVSLVASGHGNDRMSQSDIAAVNGMLNKQIGQLELESAMDTLTRRHTEHTEMTPEQRQKAESALTTSTSGLPDVSEEAKAALGGLLRQGSGFETFDKGKVEAEMKTLGGESAVAAYDKLAELKASGITADSAEWKQATQLLKSAFENHPNVDFAIRHGGANGEIVPSQRSFAIPGETEIVR